MMFKVVLAVSLILSVSCNDAKDDEDASNRQDEEEKIKKIVRLSEAMEVELLTIESEDDEIGQYTTLKIEDCIDEDVYSNDNIKEYKDDSDILCGFYAFQANKKEGTGLKAYSDASESARRLALFSSSVERVRHQNALFESGNITYTSEINFFSDMTPEEKYPYSHGIRDPSKDPQGMVVGAPVLGGAYGGGYQMVPKPRENEAEEEKIKKIVRLSDAMEVELLTIESEDDEIGQYTALRMEDCIDENVYNNENLKEYKDDSDVLCGFYAFQSNKKNGTGLKAYSDADESAERFEIFAKSVKDVLEINTKFDKGEITWTAGINFFSDMTEEEKYPYSHGIRDPSKDTHFGLDVLGAAREGGEEMVPKPRENETEEKKIKKIVRLTEALEVELLTIESEDNEIGHYTALKIEDCIDENVYSNENLKEYKDESDVLCGFYAFQANKKNGTGLKAYSDADESAERYEIFVKSVEEVLKINTQFEKGEITWTAEINFFADMSPEEQHPYSHGVIIPEISLTSGLGLTSGTDKVHQPAEEESIEEKVNKIVRLSEADEATEMNGNNNDEVSEFKTMTMENCVDEAIYGYKNLKYINSSDEYLCAFYAFQANKGEGIGLKAYADQNEATQRLGLFKKCAMDVQKTNEKYERGEISYTTAVNFFCDMTAKEKHPYSHGVRNDIAKGMTVFGVNPVDLETQEEKMKKVVRLAESDELSEISSNSGESSSLGTLSLESCIDRSIYDYENLSNIVSKRDHVCAYYAFQANKQTGVGLKRYKGNKESKKRYLLFAECLDTIKEMNDEFKSGKTIFSGGVNFFCDMTDDERKTYYKGIKKAIGKDVNSRVLVLLNNSPEQQFEDHPIGNGGMGE